MNLSILRWNNIFHAQMNKCLSWIRILCPCVTSPQPPLQSLLTFLWLLPSYISSVWIHIENFTKSSIRILSITPEETPLSVSLHVPLESKQGKTQLGSGWTVLWPGWQIWRYDQINCWFYMQFIPSSGKKRLLILIIVHASHFFIILMISVLLLNLKKISNWFTSSEQKKGRLT